MAGPYKPGMAVVYRVLKMTETSTGTLAQAPQSRRWKLRDRAGERQRWHELPEETPHH